MSDSKQCFMQNFPLKKKIESLVEQRYCDTYPKEVGIYDFAPY